MLLAETQRQAGVLLRTSSGPRGWQQGSHDRSWCVDDSHVNEAELEVREFRFQVAERPGEVRGLLARPLGAKALLVLGHGAGAGMHHRVLSGLADRLAVLGLATLRYQFPYMEQGRKAPDRAPVLVDTVRAAVEEGRRVAGDLPVFAGGKSMGGRMTSLAASEGRLKGVRGIVLLGFPLHRMGEFSTDRGLHLARVDVPLLFLQGTRDKLARLSLLEPLCRRLGDQVKLHVVEGADHSFRVPRSSGRSDDDILDELARTVSGWTTSLLV